MGEKTKSFHQRNEVVKRNLKGMEGPSQVLIKKWWNEKTEGQIFEKILNILNDLLQEEQKSLDETSTVLDLDSSKTNHAEESLTPFSNFVLTTTPPSPFDSAIISSISPTRTTTTEIQDKFTQVIRYKFLHLWY